MKKKAIIFDLDGTLWDSAQAVVDSWNEKIQFFPDIDYYITLEQMYGYMGKTMEEIGLAFFNTVSKERALELLKICMDYENLYIEEHGGVLFEGLEETLAALKEEYFEAFLKHHKLEKYFDDTENYGRTKRCKGDNIKLLVERNNIDAVYVGDTMGDYDATMQAGLPFIHAAYGFGTVPEGTPKVDDIRELPKKVKEIVSVCFTAE